jgi:protein involved in polysaccharide export with SLBB domain
VTLAENRSNNVYVLGAVKSPGVLPVTGQETLRRVLAAVGGLTKEAGMSVQVFRQVADQEQAYMVRLDDLANDKTGKVNLLVRPGDFINVPVAGTFFIDGYIERPNAYPLVRPYTLSQAVAIAGGIADFGKQNEISIVRRGPNEQVTVLNRDLSKIRSGEEDDVRIAENDLILVPPSTGKMILSTLLGMVGYSTGVGSASISLGRIRERALAMP